jgi:hypothetical protein
VARKRSPRAAPSVPAGTRPRQSSNSNSSNSSKMLSWSKVRRALDALGWDAEQFIARYEASGRRVRRPEPALMAAGQEFDRTGNLEAFRSAVLARSTQELYAKLGRYQVWKASVSTRATGPERSA